MKIGILLCGLSQPRIANKHGYYDQQFQDLLRPFGFDCKTIAVVANQLPAEDDDCDGYLISGSAHNLDEPLPWTQPLLDWIKGMYGNKPMVGVCFGHQAIAKALGGEVVASKQVYQTGVVEYAKTDGSHVNVSAWHGQQIITLPPVDLEVTASAKHCPFANIVYANKAISYQSHPEFSDEYIADLYDTHKASLDEAAQAFYKRNLGRITVDHNIGQEMADFFLANA